MLQAVQDGDGGVTAPHVGAARDAALDAGSAFHVSGSKAPKPRSCNNLDFGGRAHGLCVPCAVGVPFVGAPADGTRR